MKLTLKHTLAPALAAAAVAFSGAALAQTSPADLTVTLNVVGSCTVTPQTVAFTDQTSLSITVEDLSRNITVNCSNGLGYELGFGMGQSAQGTQRRMAASGNLINYGIYRDSGRTESLTTLGGAYTFSGTGTGADQTHVIYARLPAQPATGYGAYSDKPVMTIQY